MNLEISGKVVEIGIYRERRNYGVGELLYGSIWK